MASASDVSCSRANIRIEIKNDFTEAMDVDTVEENALSEGEVEDGEIGDVKDAAADEPMVQTKHHISFSGRNVASVEKQQRAHTDSGGFETAVDIFGKEEQEKLQHRAQRFGLDPQECQAAAAAAGGAGGGGALSDEQLVELHESLGITADNEAATRFEAIHVYGTRELSTEDVFEYFGGYGPASIEWINDESCNVVWLDRGTAASAFHGLSSPIAGMPVTGKCDPFQGQQQQQEPEEEPPLAHGRSILLVGKTRQVDVYEEDGTATAASAAMVDEDKENGASTRQPHLLHVSQIDTPVPPGYWRLGHPHPKTRHVLLRFARRTDRKPLRAERFSQYYKKYGNPNYGGIRGLISQSKKLRMRHAGRPTSAADAATSAAAPAEPAETIVSGDPWGSLAKNWHWDVRERVPEIASSTRHTANKPSKSILDRLGSSSSSSGGGTQKRAHPEPTSAAAPAADSAEDAEPASRKSKVPRMRMYADEEEARVEKVKQLQKIRQLEKIEEIISQTELRAAGVPTAALRNSTRLDVLSSARLAAAASSDTVPDLRNRIRRQVSASMKPFRAADRAPVTVKPEPRRPVHSEPEEDEDEDEDDMNVQQKSKVTVIVKKPSALVKPTVASTIWSRLDREKQLLQLQQEQQHHHHHQAKSNSHEAHSESSDSSSSPDEAAAAATTTTTTAAAATTAERHPDTGHVRSQFAKALNQRPGFNRDLKARLGLTSEHKSPLRIEINNDHYKKS